jgi:hypothetical protein
MRKQAGYPSKHCRTVQRQALAISLAVLGLGLLHATSEAQEPSGCPGLDGCESLGAPAPPETTPTEPVEADGPHPGLLIPGVAGFSTSYVLHAALVSPLAGYEHIAYFRGTLDPAWDDVRWMGLLPLAGPWIQLTMLPENAAEGWPPYLIADGLIQLAGVVLFATSFAVGSGRRVAVAPAAGPNFTGLHVGGRF